MGDVSMIMDSKHDWLRHLPPQQTETPYPGISPFAIDEFRRMLDRAGEYDRKHNEPDRELDEKRRKLKDLAKELGVEIEFV